MLICMKLFFIIIVNISATLAKNESGKNILYIIIDDLRYLTEEALYLPNLKKIENSGANFKYAYAQQALCAPSRNSLLTGRRPDSLHLYDFYNYWRDTVGNFTTIPQFFKENGYDTYSIGKVFHPGISSNYTDDYPYSWSRPSYHPPAEQFINAPVCKEADQSKLKRNLICPVEVKSQPLKSLPDLQSLKYAIKIIKRSKHNTRPYFLAIGFHKPHIPLKFPVEFLDLIPLDKVKPPKHPGIPKNMPLPAWHPWTDVRKRDDIRNLNISFPMGTMPHEWTMHIRQAYYAAAVYIDALIGILMSYVDLQTTTIVVTSDHGWSLGENGLWAKYSNFDVALRVPLVILHPGVTRRSIECPVELIDLFPTLVDLSNFANKIPKCKNSTDKLPLCFEGKSLAPLMMGKTNCKHNFATSQYPRPSKNPKYNSDKPRLKDIRIMGYSIRTRRFRYTEWIAFNSTTFTKDWNKSYGSELYDHFYDPEESDNVYLVPKYDNIRDHLYSLLKSQVN